MEIALLLAIGLSAGILSGLIGIGGGVIILPAFILLFGLNQHQAQGTTLALLVPPIGFLAAYTYFKQGYVDLKLAAFVCLGFFIGGLIGAKLAVNIPAPILKKLFASALFLIAIKLFFTK
ncbi:TSUP family transporter [Candidatus Margulisiibacteriota bacterium]